MELRIPILTDIGFHGQESGMRNKLTFIMNDSSCDIVLGEYDTLWIYLGIPFMLYHDTIFQSMSLLAFDFDEVVQEFDMDFMPSYDMETFDALHSHIASGAPTLYGSGGFFHD